MRISFHVQSEYLNDAYDFRVRPWPAGSFMSPCLSTDLVDLSVKATTEGNPAAPSLMLCKGFVIKLCFDPVLPIPGTSPPTEV